MPPRTVSREGDPLKPEESKAESSAEVSQASRASAADPGRRADGFVDEVSGPVRAVSAEDLGARVADRPSALRSSERLLETTRDRLLSELSTLQGELRETTRGLADAGFAPDAVAAQRDKLTSQRERMGRLRARLSTIHRRLRALAVAPGAVADAALQTRLRQQVDSIAKLDAGADRALAALQLATTFRPRAHDGAPVTGLRFAVNDAATSQLGDDLVRTAASAATAQAIAQLLAAGPSLAELSLDEQKSAGDADQLGRVAQAILG
jgi:hypothetical protein